MHLGMGETIAIEAEERVLGHTLANRPQRDEVFQASWRGKIQLARKVHTRPCRRLPGKRFTECTVNRMF